MKLTWGPVDIGNGMTLDTSLTSAETAELERLTSDRSVLEVGSCWGYSALMMARAGAKHVFAVDPHMEQLGGIPGSLPTMRNALRAFGVEDRVTICLSYSQIALPALGATGARFDVVFIDGDHRAPAVAHDITWARYLGQTVCVHDYTEEEWPDVQSVLDRHFPGGPTRQVDSLWILER